MEIYRPTVYRFARRRGLQSEDAEDIAQQVLVSLLRKIGEWNTDKQAGSFRAWLLTVIRNAVSNRLGRKSLDDRCGGTSVLQRLSNVVDDHEDSTMLDWELWRATFRSAATEVRPEFQETTWQAFWRTAVERKSAEQAADELGVSIRLHGQMPGLEATTRSSSRDWSQRAVKGVAMLTGQSPCNEAALRTLVAGTLDSTGERAVQMHLDSCIDCRRELNDMVTADVALEGAACCLLDDELDSEVRAIGRREIEESANQVHDPSPRSTATRATRPLWCSCHGRATQGATRR